MDFHHVRTLHVSEPSALRTSVNAKMTNSHVHRLDGHYCRSSRWMAYRRLHPTMGLLPLLSRLMASGESSLEHVHPWHRVANRTGDIWSRTGIPLALHGAISRPFPCRLCRYYLDTHYY